MNIFIIGNGFDIEHALPTKYNNFRKYLLLKYPGADEFDELVPESIIDNHGEVRFDFEDVAGYISRIIDGCNNGKDWSNLESYLGDAIFDCFLMDLDPIDMDASDKETMRAVYRNESLSSDIRNAFSQIKQLFCDWVNNCLNKLKYKGIWKDSIANVLSEGDSFLSFNYTMTLEEVYGIHNVCHIHGKVGDSENDIIFGHGDDNEYTESLASLGADYSFNELKRELRKDTHKAILLHHHFFDSLKDVKSIHSFGFSFADVDFVYVEEIARKAPGAIWYLNTRDANKQDIRLKLERLGFEVKSDLRW